MQGAEFLTCIWREQQVALAAPLVTASDGGPGQRPVARAEASGAARATCCSPHLALTKETGCVGMRKVCCVHVWRFLFNYFLERP